MKADRIDTAAALLETYVTELRVLHLRATDAIDHLVDDPSDMSHERQQDRMALDELRHATEDMNKLRKAVRQRAAWRREAYERKPDDPNVSWDDKVGCWLASTNKPSVAASNPADGKR